jgi:hypothetical protein
LLCESLIHLQQALVPSADLRSRYAEEAQTRDLDYQNMPIIEEVELRVCSVAQRAQKKSAM